MMTSSSKRWQHHAKIMYLSCTCKKLLALKNQFFLYFCICGSNPKNVQENQLFGKNNKKLIYNDVAFDIKTSSPTLFTPTLFKVKTTRVQNFSFVAYSSNDFGGGKLANFPSPRSIVKTTLPRSINFLCYL